MRISIRWASSTLIWFWEWMPWLQFGGSTRSRDAKPDPRIGFAPNGYDKWEPNQIKCLKMRKIIFWYQRYWVSHWMFCQRMLYVSIHRSHLGKPQKSYFFSDTDKTSRCWSGSATLTIIPSRSSSYTMILIWLSFHIEITLFQRRKFKTGKYAYFPGILKIQIL